MEWLLMELVSIEGGRVDYEDFEECGELDFYGPLCMLDMMEDVCIGLTDTPVVSNRGTDLEKAMTQVRKTSLFQEIVMYVQKNLQTALLASPDRVGHSAGYSFVYRVGGAAALWGKLSGFDFLESDAPAACIGSGRNQLCFLRRHRRQETDRGLYRIIMYDLQRHIRKLFEIKGFQAWRGSQGRLVSLSFLVF